MSTSPSHRELILTTAELVGDLMGFWNFQPSLGRVWTTLYLSQQPLSSAQLTELTGLSAGNISMSLRELLHWGVIRRVHSPGSRSRLYTAETEIIQVIMRVFRERELVLVKRTVQGLGEVLEGLERSDRSTVTLMMESRFLMSRIRNLHRLAVAGEKLLDRLTRVGEFDLSSVRGLLRLPKS